ncbi:LysM peptidoglycan-binding domain-containing protein [Brucella tritici]|uniref:LysM peptidoglycan-binding domain-containing protein n=2 Tax=Brucella TaxID=234 RepID=A0A6L3YTA9_9HYPH|nr:MULTISPECIES: Ig-like domain-containing protein [Brucella]KAB2666998.1 LysM peptidoglycan-binding domain-containing protein [Brucella tritici]KAB2686686.1 LysM peptidoglycan-binding domain-containing protein [Brucella tritici]KAB2772623.1 LysM peptidoglycan-binding domain-containing protein [Brucella anthropi]
MQKNSLGLLGIGLVAIVAGLGLYWNATRSRVEAPQPNATAPVSTPASSNAPAQPQATPSETKAPEATKPVGDVSANDATPQGAQSEEPAKQADAAPAEQASKTPVFDLLRVEPDGSVVIAGKALPNADVEVVAGATVVGKAKAGPNGDFAIVLDEPLKAGDHQLVLRATGADNNVATSAQTAIVSVPETKSGQVLALVEEPGQASRLITKPETAPAPQENTDAAPEVTAKADKPEAKPAQDLPIAIEAVEIEGQSVFVAGKAKGGNRVIVHANDTLLGASLISPDGRFLVQSKQPLSVGDYIIRADLLDNANQVLATARVPFRREAGENISAVASDTDGQTAAPSGANGGEAASSAAPLQKVDGSVIIRRGDNLWTISKRAYGKGTRYTTIYLANRDQIRNPDLIWPGQVFNMPKEPLGEGEVKRQLEDSAN